MPGDKGNIIAEGPELFNDRFYQCGVVATREIGAADGSLEQHIPDLGDTRRLVKKDHVPRGMTRTMFDYQLLGPKTNVVIML